MQIRKEANNTENPESRITLIKQKERNFKLKLKENYCK